MQSFCIFKFKVIYRGQACYHFPAPRPHSPNTTSSRVSQLAVTRSVISRVVMLGAYRTPASLPRTLIHNSPKTTPEP